MLYTYIIIVVVTIIIHYILITYYPIIEPFTRQFFNQIKPTYFVGIDQPQLYGNEFDLLESIKSIIPFNLDTLLLSNSIDRYVSLNNGNTNFVLSRSNEIYNFMYKLIPDYAKVNIDNIRVVCALYGLPINVITTEMRIDEFSQFKNSKLVINVGPKGGADHLLAMDLLLQYNIIVDDDVYLSYYDVNDLQTHYGNDVQVVIMSRTHPDKTIVNLVNKSLSRLVEIKEYNDGNIYHINYKEKSFYTRHPYYSKIIIEKDRLREYYPNLVINERVFTHDVNQPVESYRSLFINTIGMKYYLLSNQQTHPSTINQLLYHIKLNMNVINLLQFIDESLNTVSLNDITLQIPLHSGAKMFYQSAGLITYINNPNCIMINGRCDEKQLSEHHLDNKLGPTFDQLFNQ